MAKVLVITDGKGRNTIAPLSVRDDFEEWNENSINGMVKYTFREVEESEAKNVPAIDPSYVPLELAPEALAAKELEVKDLRAQLAELQRQLGESGKATFTENTIIGMQPDGPLPDGILATGSAAIDPAEPGSTLNQLGAGETKVMNDGILPKVKEAAKKTNA